ncbi:nucleotidyltransferase family protein [Candidatus Saganbacteria bacterium]|nr:nucleotidyltransferase family protein [Candidatus Saganbacteria bacterium]
MTEKDFTLKILSNKAAVKGYGVKKIGLFGSYIKNEATKDSDVDVLVEFNAKTFDNYMGLKLLLESLFKTKVDLVINSAIRPELRTSILRTVKYVKEI